MKGILILLTLLLAPWGNWSTAVLAREAGVKDPALDRAIAKAASFVRWYVN